MGEETAGNQTAAAAAAAMPTDGRENPTEYDEVGAHYAAVTGRTMNATDRAVLEALRREGASDALMISVMDDVARRERGRNVRICSFRYFEPIVRDAMTARYNASDGRYPESYTSAEIEAILDAEAFAAYAACPSTDYDYD